MQYDLNARNLGILFFKYLFFKKQRKTERGRAMEEGVRNYINISKISHIVIPFNSTVIQIYNRAIQICKTSAYVTTELHNAFCYTSPNYFKN